MAWDFSTEPEFQQQLDWMRTFVREEIWPIETIFGELGDDAFRRAIAPLQEQVRERGLWAAHLDPELGGQGFGQVKLGLMHEILGTTPFAPVVFGNAAPDSGNSRDPRARRHGRPEAAVAAPAARRRPQVRVLDDRAPHRRLGSDAARDQRRPATATTGSSTAASGSPPTRRWRTS